MNTWGFINSFGIFQTYYTTFLKRDPSDISWIGSIQVFLSFFISAFVGGYIDSGHLRLLLSCGTVLVLIGIFTASLSTQYWQLLLSQGICCGLGNGFLVTPAVSGTSTYFDKRRSLAIGISTCGSVTGLLYPMPWLDNYCLQLDLAGRFVRSDSCKQLHFCLSLCA